MLFFAFKEAIGLGVEEYIKFDTGYHRASLAIMSAEFYELLKRVFDDIKPKGYAEL